VVTIRDIVKNWDEHLWIYGEFRYNLDDEVVIKEVQYHTCDTCKWKKTAGETWYCPRINHADTKCWEPNESPEPGDKDYVCPCGDPDCHDEPDMVTEVDVDSRTITVTEQSKALRSCGTCAWDTKCSAMHAPATTACGDWFCDQNIKPKPEAVEPQKSCDNCRWNFGDCCGLYLLKREMCHFGAHNCWSPDLRFKSAVVRL
jgi:hypothetical protein